MMKNKRELEMCIKKLKNFMNEEDILPFPYDDIRDLRICFEDEFMKISKYESLNADLNSYFMFISGLASCGIERYFENAFELYRIETILRKPFYEQFSKYKFLECYDLREFNNLYRTFEIHEIARLELIKIIEAFNKLNSR
jgi:hypothetical protein